VRKNIKEEKVQTNYTNLLYHLSDEEGGEGWGQIR